MTSPRTTLPVPLGNFNPFAPAPAPLPFRMIFNVGGQTSPIAPGWVNPSTISGSVISGSCEVGASTCGPAPGILKATRSVPVRPATHSPDAAPEAAWLFADVIASRNEQVPSFATVSAVVLTVMVLPWPRTLRVRVFDVANPQRSVAVTVTV